MSSFQRKIIDASQKSKGRVPMRFLFKIKPISVTDIARDIEAIVFVWQRGAKIQETKVQGVNGATGSVMFDDDTHLSQSTTCYKTNGEWMSKEYKFKLQSVTSVRGMDKTKTIAKYEIDFAVFCSMGIEGGTEDIQVNMKPRGVFNATVSAQWLKDFDHSMADDAVSDMFSGYSGIGGKSTRSWDAVVDDREHDLDDLEEETHQGGVSNGSGTRRSATAQPRLGRPSTIMEAGEGTELDFNKEKAAPPPPPSKPIILAGSSQQQQSKLGGWFKKQKSGRLNDDDMDFINKQVNVDLLRKKAKDLVLQRDMEQTKTIQLQNELRILEQTVEQLSPDQRAMVNKIRSLEEQLAQSQEIDTMQLLVEAKTQLADAHYEILQLKGALHQEQVRNRQILNKFTAMQTQRDVLLNQK